MRAREARWLGPDTEAKAHRVFWPSTGTVGIERNVYFGTTAPLEGEDEEPTGADDEQSVAPNAPSTSPTSEQQGMPALVDADTDDEDNDDNDDDASVESEEQQQQQQPLPQPTPPPLRRSERIRKPSRIVRESMA